MRRFLSLLLVAALTAPSALSAAQLDLGSATIAELQAAMNKGSLTSEKLVQLYLARIDAYETKGPQLNTIITLKARETALAEARALDAERKAGKVRSPLHGVVVDVFDTKDMPTSGGFAPMATSQPIYDSFVIGRLRDAGAIILAKLNQSDWYGVGKDGGGTLKARVISPYNASKYGGGSSSGTGAAIAAWFGTVGLGSDTTGSITNPSTLNALVGFSTTHGLVSRTGMMWSSPRQENGGPMTRSLYDAAAVLDVIAGYDPADLATEASVGKLPGQPYTSFISKDGLKGARIGVLREMVRSGPVHAEGVALFAQAIADFKTAGATVIDVSTGLPLTTMQVDADAADFERATAIDKYLSALPQNAPIRSVREMIEKGGALVKPVIIETSKLTALERNTGLASVYKQQEVIRAALLDVMEKNQLDGLILPFRTATPWDINAMPRDSWKNPDVRNHLASSTGLPTIIVPGGYWPGDGMPFGVQFLGRPFSEPKLITLASGYEAATSHRKAPASTPALPGETITY
jgi:Asp-tRNA(Asn)/Glu-tRNA(Gln) amidotransferase A subunit family amidase